MRPRPTEVATVAAPAHQVQAHQLLHSWAPGPAEHATACGIAITHRIGFQALVELLDAASDLGGSLLDLDSDPPGVAAKLPMAARVLAQPTLSAAADAAAGLLAIDDTRRPRRDGGSCLITTAPCSRRFSYTASATNCPRTSS